MLRRIWQVEAIVLLLLSACTAGPSPQTVSQVPSMDTQPERRADEEPKEPGGEIESALVDAGSIEESLFRRAVETRTLEAYETYLSHFPNGHHRDAVLVLQDDLEWEQLQKARDADRVRDWLALHPATRWAAEARLRWEDLRAEEARHAEDTGLCDLYLEEFPNGRYVQEIHRWRGELSWREVRAGNDIEAIEVWLERHPNNPRAPEARWMWDDLRFVQVRDKPTLAACDRYLAELPNGAHAEEVMQLRETLLWQRARASRHPRTIEDWLRGHPSSPHIEEARRLLEDLRFEAVQHSYSFEEARRYLDDYPQGRYAAQVRRIESQALAWQRVCDADTVEGYQRYVRDASQTQFYRVRARDRIQVDYWRGRLDHSPANPHVLTQLAEACITETGCSLREVESLYRQAIELDPRHSPALLGLAKLLYNDEIFAQATWQLLEQAAALDPDNAEIHFYLGRFQARRSGCRGAMEHYDRALKLAPDLVEALFYRGLCKARIGHCRNANDDFQRVISLLVDDPQSKFVLQARQHLKSCR